MQIPTEAVTPAGTPWLQASRQNPLGDGQMFPEASEQLDVNLSPGVTEPSQALLGCDLR